LSPEGVAASTVLVTGGAGFIGSHLVARLAKGSTTVLVLDNLSSGSRQNISDGNVRLVLGDVRDEGLVDDLVKCSDTVFHLAEFIPETATWGIGHVVRYSVDNPLSDFDVGCRGTLVVLDKCRKHDKRLVFTSSAAVYGENANAPIKEEAPAVPSSPYGASKLCAETYVRLYSHLYGTRATILRLFNVYGPWQRKYLMHDVLLKLLRDCHKLEILGTGREERDFIYVDDVVDALLLVADDARTHGELYNVGSGRSTSVKDVVAALLRILGQHPDVIFTQTSWKGDVKALVADVSRIIGLGFKCRYSLEEGLRELIEWFNTEFSVNLYAHLPPSIVRDSLSE